MKSGTMRVFCDVFKTRTRYEKGCWHHTTWPQGRCHIKRSQGASIFADDNLKSPSRWTDTKVCYTGVVAAVEQDYTCHEHGEVQEVASGWKDRRQILTENEGTILTVRVADGHFPALRKGDLIVSPL